MVKSKWYGNFLEDIQMKEIRLISFAVFFITVGEAIGEVWRWPPETATIGPRNLTSSDVVAITLSGDWRNSCIANDSAISAGDNMTIEGNGY